VEWVMSIPIDRLDKYRWQFLTGAKLGMKIPAVIFADEKLMAPVRW